MKQFKFNQAALLGKGKAGHKNSMGKTYPRGVHVVSQEHQDDPTFKHFLEHKLIEPFSKKEQGTLKPAESAQAKASMESAKAQLQPEAEVEAEGEEAHDEMDEDGEFEEGEEAHDEGADESAGGVKKKKKRKKNRG